jgi:hypothetical protein
MVLAGLKKSRIMFEVSRSEAFQVAVMLAAAVWRGDSKVTLQTPNEEVIQVCAAPRSFSLKL